MSEDTAIDKRLFVVGCSRSGTTLLQVSIAAHPRVHSFPETFVFQQSTGNVPRVLPWLGVATGSERAAFAKLLRIVERPQWRGLLPRAPWRYRTAAEAYVEVFDRLAREAGVDCWLEKSPLHVHYLFLIFKYVPRAHAVHIIRDGRDVVASLVDRARRHPQRFVGQGDPAFGIKRWNRALKTSWRYTGRRGHTFVLYEDLVRRPERVMRRVCQATGLGFAATMGKGDQATAERVVPEDHAWIARARQPPQVREGPSKFERLFDAREQRQITDALRLELYEQFREHARIR